MTNDDLQSLGKLLQVAREEQALSLQEVAAQTRIRVKFLEALEDGDISILPSTTHARGFLRNYAQFLRLDVNAVIDHFSAATDTTPTGITQVTTPVWSAELAATKEPVEVERPATSSHPSGGRISTTSAGGVRATCRAVDLRDIRAAIGARPARRVYAPA